MPISDQALLRRAKRFLRSSPLGLFAQTSPGFEDQALEEIRQLGLAASTTPGGVAFTGTMAELYAVNYFTQVPSRVLLRINSFLSQSYPMLYDHIRKLPWEVFIGNNPEVSYVVSSKQSRLRHMEHIAESVHQAITQRLEPLGLSPLRTPHAQLGFHVRLHRDRATISFNTSGSPLYKRGYRTESGTAPIRENLAAALLVMVDATKFDVLVDPFCGSGTFCIEAALMARRRVTLTNRGLAMELSPLHSPGARSAGMRIATQHRAKPVRQRIFGSDQDPGAVANAQSNAGNAGAAHAKFRCRNALSRGWVPTLAPVERGLIVANLPYGVRILDRSRAIQVTADFAHNVQNIQGDWRYLLVTPYPEEIRRAGLSISSEKRFRNGGLTVFAVSGPLGQSHPAPSSGAWA